jgi:hypothetical protein
MADESFTCPRCQRTSHNPTDARYRYCGNCNEFMTTAKFVVSFDSLGHTFESVEQLALQMVGRRIDESDIEWNAIVLRAEVLPRLDKGGLYHVSVTVELPRDSPIVGLNAFAFSIDEP